MSVHCIRSLLFKMAATGSGEMVSPTHKCGKAAEISVRL